MEEPRSLKQYDAFFRPSPAIAEVFLKAMHGKSYEDDPRSFSVENAIEDIKLGFWGLFKTEIRRSVLAKTTQRTLSKDAIIAGMVRRIPLPQGQNDAWDGLVREFIQWLQPQENFQTPWGTIAWCGLGDLVEITGTPLEKIDENWERAVVL